MQWADDAIVLATRAYGESSLVVQLLTREHGRHAGLAKGAQRGKARATHQPGNRVRASWKARLDEHLGNVTAELVRGDTALLLDDADRLGALAAALALAEAALPEREPAPRVYEGLIGLLDALGARDAWERRYVAWELTLLAELGFGLDLSRCAVTGSAVGLAFVSPKTGRAVAAEAAAPYRDKLLPVPSFLLVEGAGETPPPRDVVDGLALTAHFLEQHVFLPHGRAMPPARRRFVDRIRQRLHNG